MPIIIRILPMEKINEFKGKKSELVQSDFFLNEVPSRVVDGFQGIYCFKSNKIKIDDQETYILFQYDNYIIACAKLDNTILINSHKNYKGYYILPPQTIYTFDKISLNDLNKNIFHNDPIKRFSQVCHKKILENINVFLKNEIVKNLQRVAEENLTINNNFQCEPR